MTKLANLTVKRASKPLAIQATVVMIPTIKAAYTPAFENFFHQNERVMEGANAPARPAQP